MATWHNSPVSEVLKIVLEARHPGQVAARVAQTAASYFVASYLEDFDALWTIRGAFGEWIKNLGRASSERLAFVVWDGIPPASGLIPLEQYLTPYDWAVALTLASEDLDISPPVVHIVDLASDQVPGALAPRFFALLRDAVLPHVHIYTPGEIDGLLNTVFAGDSLARPARPTTSDLEVLRRIWAGNLTKPSRPGDHHAIANILGPTILRTGMRSVDQAEIGSLAPLQALSALMKTLGLLPSSNDCVPSPWVPPKVWNPHVDRLVLVDDMADYGWTDFLVDVLGIERTQISQRMRVCQDLRIGFGPAGELSLLDLLAEKTDDDRRSLKINQGLTLTGSARELLFLDLRLFAGRNVDEMRFLKEDLLPLARQAIEGTAGLPWRGFAEAELTAVEKLTAEEIETDPYFTALTLLPRLVALVDPRLPVVLFSSTGRRKIVEALHGYDNIITSFDKPRFLGDALHSVVLDSSQRFCAALQAALVISRGRATCEALEVQTKTVELEENAASRPDVSRLYAELYLDESGAPVPGGNFAVGGLMAIYPSPEIAASFWQNLDAIGARWGYHRDAPWEPVPAQRWKKASGGLADDTIRQRLSSVAHAAAHAGIVLATCYIDRHIPVHNALSDAPDIDYRDLVAAIVELFLFEWLPIFEQGADDKIPASLFAGTRVLVPASAAKLVEYHQRFGLHVSEPRGSSNAPHAFRISLDALRRDWERLKDQVGFLDSTTPVVSVSPKRPQAARIWGRSFSFGDLYPIVARSFAARGWSRAVDKALGVRLKYYSSQEPVVPTFLARQLHYAADYVASAPDAVPDTLWLGGFRDKDTSSLQRAIESSRACDDPSRRIAAIQRWLEAGGQVPHPVSSLRWIKRRVTKVAGDLSGQEFMSLCRVLDARDPIRVGHTEAKVGKPLVPTRLGGWRHLGNRWWRCPNEHSTKAAKDATTIACDYCPASLRLE